MYDTGDTREEIHAREKVYKGEHGEEESVDEESGDNWRGGGAARGEGRERGGGCCGRRSCGDGGTRVVSANEHDEKWREEKECGNAGGGCGEGKDRGDE